MKNTASMMKKNSIGQLAVKITRTRQNLYCRRRDKQTNKKQKQNAKFSIRFDSLELLSSGQLSDIP
jgi:hypothetical protein